MTTARLLTRSMAVLPGRSVTPRRSQAGLAINEGSKSFTDSLMSRITTSQASSRTVSRRLITSTTRRCTQPGSISIPEVYPLDSLWLYQVPQRNHRRNQAGVFNPAPDSQPLPSAQRSPAWRAAWIPSVPAATCWPRKRPTRKTRKSNMTEARPYARTFCATELAITTFRAAGLPSSFPWRPR